VTIVLEHIPHGGSEQLENIVAVMERVPLPRFHLESSHAKLKRGYDPWGETLDRLGSQGGYDGMITLEVFSPQKEYLLLSRDMLRRWWGEA
jgi:hypothetical protein